MDQLSSYLQEALSWARQGYAQVNAMQGLIIALVAAYRLSGLSRLLIVAGGATIVHAVADVLLPAIVNNSAPVLPAILQQGYWQYIAVLYSGYLVLILLFYVIKKTLLNR